MREEVKNPVHETRLNFSTRFFLTTTLILGLVGIACGVWTFSQSLQCQDWPTTEGTVMYTSITSKKPKAATISYNYQVAGIRYVGTRLAFGEDLSHGQWVLERYPVGTTVMVYYAPDEPEIAVLETGLHGGTWTYLGVGTLFVVLSAILLRFGARKMSLAPAKNNLSK